MPPDDAEGELVEPSATDEELHRIPDADDEAELDEELLGAEEIFVQPAAQLLATESTLEAVDRDEAEQECPERFGDEVEPEFDQFFRLRTEVGLETEPPAYVTRRETEQLPAGTGYHEFVCSACHLVRSRTQLADPARLVCRECANNER